MRLSTIATAAGLVIATLGIGTAADAQPNGRPGYHDGHRGNDRHGHGWQRDQRRHARPHCRIEYRHHHRVRVCR